MAYTYDQFITAATGAGILDKFTDDDLNIAKNNPEYGMSALKLQQDLQGAKTTEQKLLAQESLNQLRKSYGGAVASSTAPATQNTANPAGSFSYGNETIYQQMLKDVTEPKPFEYDVAKDPNFQSMKKSYLREGDRAREDTMASFSSMTGGVPSSAAITAAQQAGDYYATQLNDSIPTLQQNAYQRYLADLDAKQAALGAITADRNFDWQKYLQEQDQQMAAKQQEWNNAFALYQKLGYATPEIAAILGIESKVPQQYTVYYNPKPETGPQEEQFDDLVNPFGIRVIQNQLGVKQTGEWDDATVAAAQKKWGTSTPYGTLEAYQNERQANATVSNRNGNGWVAVGGTRYTYPELLKKVERGEVVEIYDINTNKIKYEFAK